MEVRGRGRKEREGEEEREEREERRKRRKRRIQESRLVTRRVMCTCH